MSCICNKKVPRVARGNNFTLIVELQQLVISDEGKEITTQIEGTVGFVKIFPSNGEPTTLNQGTDWRMAQTSNGAAVAIDIPSKQPLGAYGIEITGTRTGGGAFRWYAKPGEGFIIVDASSDNYLTDMVRIYTVTGVVGVGSSSSGGGSEQVQADWNQTDTEAKDYIKNKPAIPAAQVQSDWDQTNTEAKDYIKNKPAIPAAQVQADWNQTNTSAKDFIKNKPTIPAAQVQSDWDQTNTEAKDYIKNKPTIPAEQIQSDWNQTNTNAKDFVKNKPTIPSLSGYATQQWVGQQGFLTQHQDISGKEDKLTIATALAANSTAEFGKYYRLSLSSATTINLPAVTGNETTVKGFLIYLTVNTGGSVDWNANNNEPIVESGLSSIAEGKTYEVNAAWNGIVWAITVNEFTAYSTT